MCLKGRNKGESEKGESSGTFLLHCRAQTLRKYLINFDVYDNTVPALSGWERGVQGSAESKEAATSFNGQLEEWTRLHS